MSKDLHFDPKQLSHSGKQLISRVQPYTAFIFILAILFIYVFLVLRISSLSQAEPTEEAVSDKMGSSKRLKVDQSAINKIKQLEDQNIGVQSLFESARDNPFQD